MAQSMPQLTNRTQAFASIVVTLLAIMGLSPFFDIIINRWPLHFGDITWRFQTIQLMIANGPQFVVIISVLAVIGVAVANRTVIRGTSVALAVIALLFIIMLPIYLLDFLQTHRLVAEERKMAFNLTGLKSAGYTALIIVGGGLAAIRGWQASESPDAKARRTKGDGLVVGQEKETSPRS